MSFQFRIVFGLCVIAVLLYNGECQSFRQCKNCFKAKDLADCAGLINCTATENCYMEEVIDIDTAEITYNAGCRSQVGCGKASANFGRKKRDVLVSCGRCCKDPFDMKTGKACNEFLCGIPQGDLSGKCYKCGDFQSMTGVETIAECNTQVKCENNEMCRASKYEVLGKPHYIFGCFRKTICQIFGLRALQQYAIFHKIDFPALTHRKETLCDMCCGDGLCNKDDCTRMTESMYIQWKAGKLDLHTLKTINGTTSVTKLTPTTTPLTKLETMSTTPTTSTTPASASTTTTTIQSTTPLATSSKAITSSTRVTLTANTPTTVTSATTFSSSPLPSTTMKKTASPNSSAAATNSGTTVTSANPSGKVTFKAPSVAISVNPAGTSLPTIAPPIRNGSGPAIG